RRPAGDHGRPLRRLPGRAPVLAGGAPPARRAPPRAPRGARPPGGLPATPPSGARPAPRPAAPRPPRAPAPRAPRDPAGPAAAAPVELEVAEGPVKVWADVTAPLSTGLFLDLREGRRAIASWAAGRRVLNLFSYTGAISLWAQHGGAESVCAVDVSPKAHARAR